MKVVAYYRVSTAKQGASGLGLEGQRSAVEEHARRLGAQIIQSYVEVESGRKKARPELEKALGHAGLAKATLVVAKLDRLARNVAFLSALMESEVEFVACDNPHANRLTIHILAAVAEDEARRISERTKDALTAAKRQGVKLGSAREGHWEGREDRRRAGARAGNAASARSRRSKAQRATAFLLPEIERQRADGKSYRAIADLLNEQGHTTRRGAQWSAAAVWRLDQLQDAP